MFANQLISRFKTTKCMPLKLFSLLSLIIFHLLLPELAQAQVSKLYRNLQVEMPFSEVLFSHPEFMEEGDAALLFGDSGKSALFGIGKVVVEDMTPAKVLHARRIGEIRARTAILELRDGLEIRTSRGFKESLTSGPAGSDRTSVSACFQVTESRIHGLIDQLPVIGTWWAVKRNILYVAVGKMLDQGAEEGDAMPSQISSNERQMPHDLLMSLLRASPLVCSHGGVRGFLLKDGRKALVAVSSTRLKGSLSNARRIAKVKALRDLLGHMNGIELSSVERLQDGELLMLKEDSGSRYEMLSNFLSVEEAKVSGIIEALPVIATWEDTQAGLFYVAIGEIFDTQPR